MKKWNWMTASICIMLSFMCVFVSVGYAKLSGTLSITGTAAWREPAVVFIKSVEATHSNNITGNKASVTKAGFVVFQHGNYTLNRQTNTKAGGSVTIKVVVKNNSGVPQYFADHTINGSMPDNVTVTYSGIKKGEVLQHGEVREFTITIQNTNRYGTLALKNAESMLHFSPTFDAGDTENKTLSLAEIFLNVLAGTGPMGDGEGIIFKGKEVAANKIMDELTKLMTSVDTGGYVGNVGNASEDQKGIIDAIFGENMIMEIGSQYYSVSILIKNQQIDGKDSSDMVMYITMDQLNMGGGRWSNGWKDLNIVPVYALVFIKGRDGYTYCDHLFAGQAPVCNYAGDFGDGNIGNFNTNLWDSTEYPTLTDSSNGQITQNYITKDGELDDAYKKYVK